MSKATQELRGRPVTHAEARASAERFVNFFFHSKGVEVNGLPQIGRVVRPSNDDAVLYDYIEEQRTRSGDRYGSLDKFRKAGPASRS